MNVDDKLCLNVIHARSCTDIGDYVSEHVLPIAKISDVTVHIIMCDTVLTVPPCLSCPRLPAEANIVNYRRSSCMVYLCRRAGHGELTLFD